MAQRAAKIKGKFLVPGVSRNGRQYTPENIASAVKRMQEDLRSGNVPLTMATSHGAAHADDALSTIGRITSVGQSPDGSATFEADIADTAAGRDIAALVTAENPYIKTISIRGQWASDPYEVTTESGERAVTADELAVVGIDFTNRPGVAGAELTHAELAESADPALICESVEDASVVDFTEEVSEADKKPYGDVAYADPGYQKDKKKRYPINTAAHVRAAWSYVNVAENQKPYSSAQLARIKSRIKSAAKKFDVDIQGEAQALIDDLTEVLEAYASVCYDNGAATINISGMTDDAGKLAPLGARLAYAAAIALNAVDPDNDGDVDLVMPDGTRDSSSSGPESTPDDDAMEQALHANCLHCGGMVDDSAMYCPMCGQPIEQVGTDGPSASDQDKNMEAIVPTETPSTETEATEAESVATEVVEEANATPVTAPKAELSEATIKNLSDTISTGVATALAGVLGDILKPAAAPVTESPAATEAATTPEAPADEATERTYTAAETLELIREAEARASERTAEEAIQQFRRDPQRKGFASGGTNGWSGSELTEGGELDPRKLAEMSGADFMKLQESVWARQPYRFTGHMDRQPGVIAPAAAAAAANASK